MADYCRYRPRYADKSAGCLHFPGTAGRTTAINLTGSPSMTQEQMNEYGEYIAAAVSACKAAEMTLQDLQSGSLLVLSAAPEY